MTTTHHGLRWGPVKPVKVPQAPPVVPPPNKLPSTMAEALAKVHRPGPEGWCGACWLRWPCNTGLLIEEWHAERTRVQLLEEAIRLFREQVRELEALSVTAVYFKPVYVAEIEAARAELLVRQEVLFSLLAEKEQ